MDMPCIVMLLGGGVFYTTGVIFYRWESMKYHHLIWHFFVLAGATCHYVAVLISVTGF
jgi:hemolysin III